MAKLKYMDAAGWQRAIMRKGSKSHNLPTDVEQWAYELKKIEARATELQAMIRTGCPHPLDYLRLDRYADDRDTLGNLRRGGYDIKYDVTCSFCGCLVHTETQQGG